MTLMPGLKGRYDAWNRLVKVRDSANSLIARYDYNGVNQRIQKVKDNVVTHSYFNEQWQELETREPGTVSPNSTYVWGLRYIDDLIYRQRGAEKLYSLADANWNVVAITDSVGAVQERLKYDAFGKVEGLTSDWNRTFTGQVLDSDTGLMLYRNRYYHTGLGRFIQRDPIGYEAEDAGLYRYVFNSPNLNRDKYGLKDNDNGKIIIYINPDKAPLDFNFDDVKANILEIFKDSGICVTVKKIDLTADKLNGYLGKGKGRIAYPFHIGFHEGAPYALAQSGRTKAILYSGSLKRTDDSRKDVSDWAIPYANIIVHEAVWHGVLGNIDGVFIDYQGLGSTYANPRDLLKLSDDNIDEIINQLK